MYDDADKYIHRALAICSSPTTGGAWGSVLGTPPFSQTLQLCLKKAKKIRYRDPRVSDRVDYPVCIAWYCNEASPQIPIYGRTSCCIT